MPKTNQRQTTQKRPEKKIGPYPGGIGVAIWLNTIETENGPRKLRSITVSPRRYRDSETGEWKDAGSYNPGDLPALIFALQKAQEFCYTVPIPAQERDYNDAAF
jgi:hypothetical protein